MERRQNTHHQAKRKTIITRVESGIIAFWTNSNIEAVNFEEILEKMKEYVEPGIEEICDWISDTSPISYIHQGEELLLPSPIRKIKRIQLYKKVTPY